DRKHTEKAFQGRECQEPVERTLRLGDLYRPLHANMRKNAAQNLQGKESSREEEIVNKDAGEMAGVIKHS
uniref:Uncharacterized protein n=1 Tax=Peromyscus maniculatus bairdii TaxID=230844 RepID=A0A8C8UNZ9_PERMB